MFRFSAVVPLAVCVCASSALAQTVPMPVPRPLNLATVQEAAPAAAPVSILASDQQQLAAAPEVVHPSVTSVPVDRLDQDQRTALAQVNAYFNSVTALTGRFIQISPDGHRTEGTLYLKKPGKLRFEFAAPSKLQIIADGKSVAVRDKGLNTQDIYPLSQTPLRYLLQPDIDLVRDTKITGVYVEPELISIALEETNRIAGTSRLLLNFDGRTKQLKQWTVTDAQGLDTVVMIYDINQNASPPDRLFAIDFTPDPSNRR